MKYMILHEGTTKISGIPGVKDTLYIEGGCAKLQGLDVESLKNGVVNCKKITANGTTVNICSITVSEGYGYSNIEEAIVFDGDSIVVSGAPMKNNLGVAKIIYE